MPLPLPRLDNRNFDQLVEEGLTLLPRSAPGWTDHNLHDPGITLVDLFAWLVEMDLYQLDRIPPAAFRAFLRLVGCEPCPAQVAETAVVLQVDPKDLPIILPAGRQVTSQDGQVKFQTARSLVVLPAQLVSVLAGDPSAGSPVVPPIQLSSVLDGLSLLDCTEANKNPARRFNPFGPDPLEGSALYLGYDQALPPDSRRVSLYVWANPPEPDRLLRQRLITECRLEVAHLKACRYRQSCPQPSLWQHYSARTVWEYYAEFGGWLPLERVLDETRGLTLSGGVRFQMPAGPAHAKGGVATRKEQFFIRCRLASGYYECPPEIQHIALNAVPARHAADIKKAELLGDQNSGGAGQTFTLQHSPVVPGSTRLSIDVKGKVELWREELDWDRAGPFDRTYVLSPETGQITFGDGRCGRVPEAGAKITAVYYRQGGGRAGNVPAGRLTQWPGTEKVSVVQPFAANGGADAEPLAEAKGRAVAWLSDPQRAVTLDDFVHLALATPGAPVRRAYALPDYDPALPGLPAAGSVTLVIVPGCANPIPEPGPDMLRTVAQYLERRRTLTTELHVIGPSFVTVAVHATLHAAGEADASQVVADAQASLNKFLDPLHGGADGQGWPFGRDVYRSEIMALLNAIPGVTFVDEMGFEVESELDVYRGYVRWVQVFEHGPGTTTLRAQFRIETQRVASRVTAQAKNKLESYFTSGRGKSRHVLPTGRSADVSMILCSIPGVLGVEKVKLEDPPGSGASCGNLAVCPHSLVLPGKHHITVSGGRTANTRRATQPPC